MMPGDLMVGYKEKILEEVGKLRGNVKRLWSLREKEKIDRNEAKNVIQEVRKSLKVLCSISEELFAEKVSDLAPDKYFLLTMLTGKSPDQWAKDSFRFSPYESSISTILHELDDPSYYDDKKVKEDLSRFVENLETELTKIEAKSDIGKYGLQMIAEFTATFPIFTENWAIAACYLSALEIVVNKKLEDLGLSLDAGFKEKYRKLLEELKNREIEVSELERKLPEIFWDIRHRVIHSGYPPSIDELDLITTYIGRVLKTLLRL